MAHDSTSGLLPPRDGDPGAATTTHDPADLAPTAGLSARTEAREAAVSATRTSTVWTVLAGLVLLAILVFILQNGRKATVHFLMLHGQLSLGIALLFAVLLGGLLVLSVAAARIIQLRHAGRKRHS